MKGKKLSSYAAIFIITLIGGAATLLLVNAANSSGGEPEYAGLDPTDLNADFGH